MILAGVSLNAIVGDNGIINNTLSASFIQEMTAVQEAFDTWKMSKKIDDLEDVSLPTEKIVESKTLEEHKRLMGEVGYYRSWSVTGEKPTTDVKEDEDSFKSAGSSEIVFYPAGVQDLYYLDNDTLGLEKNNKKYLIDAQNSMIYSLNGGTINGIQVHSLAMFRMIQSGISDAPQFAEAEASSGSGVFAGSKWLTDKDGNYIDEKGNRVDEEHRVENPYGFEIIADKMNNNIYKLYNNGELYGKGIKGPLLNTSADDMEKINPYKWSKLTIPSQIPGYNTNNIKIKTSFNGSSGTIYVIDTNKDLWAWGSNANNKLGLNTSQLKEYTGMEPIKLNIGGSYDSNGNSIGSKKVYDVMATSYATFVITLNEGTYELYASGYNIYGELGTGEEGVSSSSFKKVDFKNPENIVKICGDDLGTNVIIYKDNNNLKLFFAGFTHGENTIGSVGANLINLFKNTEYNNKNCTKFVEIFDGNIGAKPSVKIIDYTMICWDNALTPEFICLGDDGEAYLWDFANYQKVETDNKSGRITEVRGTSYRNFILKKELDDGNVEFFGYANGTSTTSFLNFTGIVGKTFLLNNLFPDGVSGNDIVDFKLIYQRNAIFITKDKKIFGCGHYETLGKNLKSGFSNGFEKIESNESFTTFLDDGDFSMCVLVDQNNNLYTTYDKKILFREEILQQNWTLIASNVKKFKADTDSNCSAYIDKNNDLWVAGDDTWILGMNTAESGTQETFVRLKDYLNKEEIYNHIDGKVKDYYFSTKKMFILTDENDKYENNDINNLYVSGHYKSYSWNTYSFLGTGKQENCIKPTKILGNVEQFMTLLCENVALVNNEGKEEIYAWGQDDGGTVNKYSEIPNKWEGATNLIENADNVSLLGLGYCLNYMSYTKNDTNYLVCNGRSDDTHPIGCFESGRHYVYDYAGKINLNNEKVDKMVGAGLSTGAGWIIMTSDKKFYGFSNKKILGLKIETDEYQSLPIEINFGSDVGNVIDIAGGNGWFVVTTSDGRVFGTGSNNYGVLGRWKGVSRGSSNSCYKTAFEWVECPELEI